MNQFDSSEFNFKCDLVDDLRPRHMHACNSIGVDIVHPQYDYKVNLSLVIYANNDNIKQKRLKYKSKVAQVKWQFDQHFFKKHRLSESRDISKLRA